MTSQKEQIQTLIAEIDGVLQRTTPRLPWVMSGEVAQQRQVLERVRNYLVALQQSGLSEVAGLGGTPWAVGFPPSGSPSEASSQQMMQALLQEMTYLRANLSQVVPNQQQLTAELVQVLMSRLQESLSQQIAQTLSHVSNQSLPYGSNPAPYGSNPALSGGAGGALATTELQQIQAVRSRSDQMLVNLDSTLNIVFESLQRNIQAYQESLSNGLERMHSLGQQGEITLKTLLNQLTQELKHEIVAQLQQSMAETGASAAPTAIASEPLAFPATTTAPPVASPPVTAQSDPPKTFPYAGAELLSSDLSAADVALPPTQPAIASTTSIPTPPRATPLDAQIEAWIQAASTMNVQTQAQSAASTVAASTVIEPFEFPTLDLSELELAPIAPLSPVADPDLPPSDQARNTEPLPPEPIQERDRLEAFTRGDRPGMDDEETANIDAALKLLEDLSAELEESAGELALTQAEAQLNRMLGDTADAESPPGPDVEDQQDELDEFYQLFDGYTDAGTSAPSTAPAKALNPLSATSKRPTPTPKKGAEVPVKPAAEQDESPDLEWGTLDLFDRLDQTVDQPANLPADLPANLLDWDTLDLEHSVATDNATDDSAETADLLSSLDASLNAEYPLTDRPDDNRPSDSLPAEIDLQLGDLFAEENQLDDELEAAIADTVADDPEIASGPDLDPLSALNSLAEILADDRDQSSTPTAEAIGIDPDAEPEALLLELPEDLFGPDPVIAPRPTGLPTNSALSDDFSALDSEAALFAPESEGTLSDFFEAVKAAETESKPIDPPAIARERPGLPHTLSEVEQFFAPGAFFQEDSPAAAASAMELADEDYIRAAPDENLLPDAPITSVDLNVELDDLTLGSLNADLSQLESAGSMDELDLEALAIADSEPELELTLENLANDVAPATDTGRSRTDIPPLDFTPTASPPPGRSAQPPSAPSTPPLPSPPLDDFGLSTASLADFATNFSTSDSSSVTPAPFYEASPDIGDLTIEAWGDVFGDTPPLEAQPSPKEQPRSPQPRSPQSGASQPLSLEETAQFLGEFPPLSPTPEFSSSAPTENSVGLTMDGINELFTDAPTLESWSHTTADSTVAPVAEPTPAAAETPFTLEGMNDLFEDAPPQAPAPITATPPSIPSASSTASINTASINAASINAASPSTNVYADPQTTDRSGASAPSDSREIPPFRPDLFISDETEALPPFHLEQLDNLFAEPTAPPASSGPPASSSPPTVRDRQAPPTVPNHQTLDAAFESLFGQSPTPTEPDAAQPSPQKKKRLI